MKELINRIMSNDKKEYLLRDIADFQNGKGHEQDVVEDGKYILITSKAISTNFSSYRTTDVAHVPLSINDIVLVMSDLPNGRALAKAFLVTENDKYTLNQRICRLTIKEEFKELVLPNYLQLVLNRNEQLLKYDNGVDQTNLKKDDILDIKIMIPNVDIQRDICDKLLKFQNIILNLSSEIDIREKQFKYYINKIFKNNNTNDYIKYNLCDVSTKISAGGDVPKDTIKGMKEPDDEYKYPVYSNGSGENALYGYCKTYSVDSKAVTIAARGTVGFHAVRDPYFTPVVRLITIIPNDEIVIAEYLNYALYNAEITSTEGGIKQITTPMIKKIDIMIPSKVQQEKDVAFLRKFEELIEKINNEITIREKQYDYFKRKLIGE